MEIFWCRYSTGGRNAGRQGYDLKVTSTDAEQAAIAFWSINQRNHRLPVKVIVINREGTVQREVEVAKAVIARELLSYMIV